MQVIERRTDEKKGATGADAVFDRSGRSRIFCQMQKLLFEQKHGIAMKYFKILQKYLYIL